MTFREAFHALRNYYLYRLLIIRCDITDAYYNTAFKALALLRRIVN